MHYGTVWVIIAGCSRFPKLRRKREQGKERISKGPLWHMFQFNPVQTEQYHMMFYTEKWTYLKEWYFLCFCWLLTISFISYADFLFQFPNTLQQRVELRIEGLLLFYCYKDRRHVGSKGNAECVVSAGFWVQDHKVSQSVSNVLEEYQNVKLQMTCISLIRNKWSYWIKSWKKKKRQSFITHDDMKLIYAKKLKNITR